jgi:hypothetical protein
MPVLAVVAILPNLDCPVCDRRKGRIADQEANPRLRVLCQASLGQPRYNLMPFMPPLDKGR